MEVTPSSNAGGARDEVERLAEELVERRRRGERPTIEEYVAAHPALAEEIRRLFTTILFVEDLGLESVANTQAESRAELKAAPELKQVGEYHILREIGRGGMGIVYEAEQASLGRRVALKVLPFHFLLDAKRLERFEQEARAAARLSHPNIVPVFGVGEHVGLHYYVMQLIPGQGLNRVIEELRRQRQTGDADGAGGKDSSSSLAKGLESAGDVSGRGRYFHNVARLIRDAALALDYAHAEGILHRDVKPSNLLLDPSGRVWLTDFGLAKAEGSDDITHSGDFVGTVLYMAPERFKGWSDPRSDVYALGITLYELLTLQPIFSERDRAELLRKVAGEEPPTPRRLDRTIPRDLETIVLKAIAKEPLHRYGKARSMAQDLDRFLEGLPVEARRSGTLERLWRWCARNRLIAALAATVFVVLVAGTVVSTIMAARLAVEQKSLLDEQKASQESLRSASLSEASALRASARPGRRLEALAALGRAVAIRPGPDLVDEALACFALVDLRSVKTWSKQKNEAFAFSPDGSTFATALPGGEIILRAADDRQERYRLPSPGFPAGYAFLRFNRDGRFLASRHEEGARVEWRIWDVDSRRLCAEVKDAANKDWIDFDPDGRWVVMGTKARSLRLVELVGGKAVEEIGRGLLVNAVAVHPGARLIAFSSDSTRKVHIYDRHAGQMLRHLAGTTNLQFEQVAWHPDGRTLAAANADHLVYIWNAETGELTRTLRGHLAQVIELAFSSGGEVLASAGWEPAVRFWDPASEVNLFSIHESHGYFSRDPGSCWTVGAERDRVERWELQNQLPAFTLFGHEGRLEQDGNVSKHPHTIALAPGGRLAATAGDDGARLWDLVGRTELCQLGDSTIHSVLFDPMGKALYTSGTLGLFRWPIRALNERSGRIAVGPAQRLTGFDRWRKASLGNGGRTIAAVHNGNHVHIFDPNQSERVIVLYGPPPEWFIDLSDGGAWAAAGSFHGKEVWLWELHGAHPKGQMEPARKLPASGAEVKFNPAGTHLATCTAAEIKLWNLKDGEPAWRIERERGLRYRGALAFSDEGNILAMTHSDSRIWLVEASSGKKLSELEAPERMHVNALAIAGGRLVACTYARRFHVWDLNGLSREVDRLGLKWQVPASGPTLAELSPLRVTVVKDSLDLLRDESSALAPRQLFRPLQQVAFLPELIAFADIDRALASPSLLIAEGEPWKYFRGRAEPSTALDWTHRDFDDSRWQVGNSPLTGLIRPASFEGTVLNDQVGSYTTLFLRRGFVVADPKAVSRLTLAVEIEDGFVAFLNGQEIGRVNAGKPGEMLPFQALAKRTYRSRVTEVVEINPALLESGKNVLALQILSYGLESKLYALPVLAAVLVPDVEQDERRTENLLAGPDGSLEVSLLAYRQGRILQRAGSTAKALEQFERAAELDRGSAEPLLRRLACHRRLNELPRTESLVHEAIERGEILEGERMWRAWFHTTLIDSHRSPQEALASLPRDPRPGAADGTSSASNYRWLLEELAANRALRINCGGDDHEAKDLKRWTRDRFFLGGASSDRKIGPKEDAAPTPGDDKQLHGIDRWFPGANGTFSHAYSIPLPAGRYRVSLHFIEATHRLPGRRVFDIHLEGKVAFEGYDPVLAGLTRLDIRPFEIEVRDGALEIDFVAHSDVPRITALEVEAAGE